MQTPPAVLPHEAEAAITAISAPLPPDAVRMIEKPLRNGGTARIPYLPWFLACDLMDSRAPGWCSEIRRVNPEAASASITLRVTVPLPNGASIWREATGTDDDPEGDYGEPLDRAEAAALKRAFSKFGLGRRELYDKETRISGSPETGRRGGSSGQKAQSGGFGRANPEETLRAARKAAPGWADAFDGAQSMRSVLTLLEGVAAATGPERRAGVALGIAAGTRVDCSAIEEERWDVLRAAVNWIVQNPARYPEVPTIAREWRAAADAQEAASKA